MRKTLSFLTGETTRVFNLLAPGPPFTGVHETRLGGEIRRGWKSDLSVRRRPLPLLALN